MRLIILLVMLFLVATVAVDNRPGQEQHEANSQNQFQQNNFHWNSIDWDATRDRARETAAAIGNYVKDQFNRYSKHPQFIAPLPLPGMPPPAITTQQSAPQDPSAKQPPNDYVSRVTPSGYQLIWPASKMPLKVFIADGTGVPNYRDTYRLLLMDAFDAWSNASKGKIDWMPVNSREQADLECSWTTKLTRSHGAWEAGNAYLMSMYSPITRSGAIMNGKVELLTGLNRPFTDGEMRRICLHEVGHALGLQGHSNKAGDVMFPVAISGMSDRLSARDNATIQTLYANHPVKEFKLSKESPRVPQAGDPSRHIFQNIQYEFASMVVRAQEEINKVDWNAEWSKAVDKAKETAQVARDMAGQIAASARQKAERLRERAEKAM